MESGFRCDFSRVRVHRDARAAEAARVLSAQAFTVGEHIALRAGTEPREAILAHELAHVVQQRTADRVAIGEIEPPGSPNEIAAESAASIVTSGGVASVGQVAHPARVALTRDTQLQDYLQRFEQAAAEIRALPDNRARVERIVQHFSGVNLRDDDNLEPVSDAVSRRMPEDTLLLFLQVVETDVRVQQARVEEARMQQTERMLRVKPGAGVGPGLFPMMGATAEVIAGGTRRIGASLSAFLEGVVEGMGGPGSNELVQKLSNRLKQAAILTAVTPIVFAAGAVVGIGQDVWKAIKGVWELITNFPAMLEQFAELFRLMTSPTGPALSRVAGRHVGKGFRADLEKMADYNVFRFTYEMGRIVGPTIVYIVLAILGIGVVEIVGEAASGLLQLFKESPAIMRIIEKIGTFVKRRPPNPLKGLTEAEIGAALETMEAPRVTGGAKPRIGGKAVPTRRVPRLEAADIPLQAGEDLGRALARIRRIVGHKLSDFQDVEAAWNRARAWVLRNRQLSAQNYEELYNATRSRFWREVRGDPAATARFGQAGFIFPQSAESAAVLGGVNSAVPIEERLVSLDHILEKAQGTNWQRALDADNLRFEFARPNSFREIVQMRHPELRPP